MYVPVQIATKEVDALALGLDAVLAVGLVVGTAAEIAVGLVVEQCVGNLGARVSLDEVLAERVRRAVPLRYEGTAAAVNTRTTVQTMESQWRTCSVQ